MVSTTTSFSVQSEVGQLRQAIVHRPGLELSRLTPENIGELLFDDVLWAKKAKEEHDAFAESLREKGVEVHYYGQLLAEVLEIPEGRAFVLDRICTAEILGPTLVGPLRRLLEDLDGTSLASYLVGGVLKGDMHPMRREELEVGHAARRRLPARALAEPPVPTGQLVLDLRRCLDQPMAKPARQRETLHSRAIYNYHPMFADADFVTYYGDDDLNHLPASVEGGDVHVIGNGTVMIGMGERTTPWALRS